ncbi:MAG: hypothetical protein FJ288_19720 [Planctomycetes bacterium]|nr:hypothetical protein [Planctomycetota bacterium]
MTIGKPLNEAWQQAFGGSPAVSRELGILVPAVCEEIERRPTDRATLRASLEGLLRFLSSPEGRTDANCRAVDIFFCLPEEHGWSGAWDHLPPEFQDLLGDFGGALHDTVTAPEIAQNFDSTPEQLLDRTLKIVP